MGRSNNYRSSQGEQLVNKKYLELLRHWPVEKIEHQVSTRHGNTVVYACGNAENPPLVLLHGACGNTLMWLKQVQSYLKSHCVYAIDIIGEANSSEPSRPKLKSNAYVEWLEDVFQQLSIKRAAIVGFSLGAWISLRFAATWPDRVERLALLSPAGIVGLRKSFRLKLLLLSLMMGPVGRRLILRRFLLTGQDNHQLELNQLIAQHFKPRSWAVPSALGQALPPLYCPVLLMLGGQDALYNPDKILLKISKQIPQLELIYRNKEGHFLDDYTREVDRFLVTEFAPD